MGIEINQRPNRQRQFVLSGGDSTPAPSRVQQAQEQQLRDKDKAPQTEIDRLAWEKRLGVDQEAAKFRRGLSSAV